MTKRFKCDWCDRRIIKGIFHVKRDCIIYFCDEFCGAGSRILASLPRDKDGQNDPGTKV